MNFSVKKVAVFKSFYKEKNVQNLNFRKRKLRKGLTKKTKKLETLLKLVFKEIIGKQKTKILDLKKLIL
jgi:hypothetical protein